MIGYKENYSVALYFTPLIVILFTNTYNIWFICQVRKKLKDLVNPVKHETYNVLSYYILIIIMITSILNWVTSSFRWMWFLLGNDYK